jgi:large subunit ribosomal protein L21e
MARSHGERLKTRHKFNKDLRARGFSPVSRAIQDFVVGQKVHIDIDSSIHKGMPNRRFQGRTASVIGQRGRAYLLEMYDGNLKKMLIVRPQHLKPQKSVSQPKSE